MFIEDDEKEGRKAALKKLLDVMGKGAGDKMSSLKKPVAVGIEIDHEEPDEDDMGGESDFDDDDTPPMEKPMMDDSIEPSESDKAMIAKLYHKYC